MKDELCSADAEAADEFEGPAVDDAPLWGDAEDETQDDANGEPELPGNVGERVGDGLADVDEDGAGLLDEERLAFAEFEAGALPEDERLAAALALKDTEAVADPLRDVLGEDVCVGDELAVREGVGDADGLVDARMLPEGDADAARDTELVGHTENVGDVDGHAVERVESVGDGEGEALAEFEPGVDGDAAPLGVRADDADTAPVRDTVAERLKIVDADEVGDVEVDAVAATDDDEAMVSDAFTLAEIGAEADQCEDADAAAVAVDCTVAVTRTELDVSTEGETLAEVVPLPSAVADTRTLTDATRGDAVAQTVPMPLPLCDMAADEDGVVDDDTLAEPLGDEKTDAELAPVPESGADAVFPPLGVGDPVEDVARVTDVDVVPENETEGDPVEADDSVESPERDGVPDGTLDAEDDEERSADADDWPERDADGEIDGDDDTEREPEGESVVFAERLDDGVTLWDGVADADLDVSAVAEALPDDPLDREASATLIVGE